MDKEFRGFNQPALKLCYTVFRTHMEKITLECYLQKQRVIHSFASKNAYTPAVRKLLNAIYGSERAHLRFIDTCSSEETDIILRDAGIDPDELAERLKVKLDELKSRFSSNFS